MPGPERRNAHLVVAGQAVSLLGDYIAYLALPLFVLDLTGSALDLGLTTAFETLPTLLFGFAAGVALDRIVLRRAVIVADLGRGLGFAALAVAAATGVAQTWMVFAVAFMVGTLAVGFDSGLQAWMPALLDEADLVVVNSRLQFVRALAWAIGPPTAGFLIAVGGGFGPAFGVDAATFIVSALFIVFLVEVRARPRAEKQPPWWPSFTEGIRYLLHEPKLRTATFAATISNLLFVPMEALLVLFATDRLGLEDEWLVGWFFAGHAVLGALGVAAAPRVARRLGLGRTFVLGIGMLGGGFLSLALLAPGIAALTPVWSTAVAAVPAGVSVAGVSFTNVALTTLRQRIPPPHLLGRVIAASRTLAWAGLPVGAALGGALGEALGVAVVYTASAGMLVATGAVLLATSLWRDPDPAEAAEAPTP